MNGVYEEKKDPMRLLFPNPPTLQSTMLENKASAHVLIKNGFTLVKHSVDEDWGYPEPTPADKWIR